MKRKLTNIFLSFVATCCLTSCLNDGDDEVTLVYYDDTAITSFTLGTLERQMTGKDSKGQDSVYTTTLNAGVYKFRINQQTREIYNPDSLPYGTDVSKCTCTVSTKNSGTVVIKVTPESEEDDSLYLVSSSDSLDFSYPRELRVYNGRATAYRSYTLKVNVHQQKEDDFGWQSQTQSEDLQQLTNKRVVSLNGRLLVFGRKAGAGALFLSDDGKEWRAAQSNVNMVLDANVGENMAVYNGKLYILTGNLVLSSPDGEQWTQETSNATLVKLIGAGKNALYALTATGLSSSADGKTWTPETLDDHVTLLPTENLQLVSLPQQTVAGFNRLLLFGNRNKTDYPADRKTMIWGKIETTGPNAVNEPWTYYSLDEEVVRTLPRLDGLQGLVYDKKVYAFGTVSSDNTSESYVVYYTENSGLTWTLTSSYQLPAELVAANETFTLTVDNNDYLWLVGENGKIWKGRLSQLGW